MHSTPGILACRTPWTVPPADYPTCTQIHTFQNPLPFFLLIPLITVTLCTLLFYPVYHLSLSDSHCSGRSTEIKDFCLIHALLWPQVLKQWLAHNNTEYISVKWMKVPSLPPLPLILWIEHLICFHPLLFYNFWELGITFTIFKTDKVSHTPTHLLPNSLRTPTQVWA